MPIKSGRSLLTGVLSGFGSGLEERRKYNTDFSNAIAKMLIEAQIKKRMREETMGSITPPSEGKVSGYTFNEDYGYVPKYDVPSEKDIAETENIRFVSDILKGIGGDKSQFRPKGISAGGMTLERVPTEAEIIAEEERKAKILSPGEKIQKRKSRAELVTEMQTYPERKKAITDAMDATSKLSKAGWTGLGGRLLKTGATWFNPNDPMLSEWQKVKSVLSNQQLMYTAKTKGAISDREMELFAQAAANDDVMSIARMKPILDRALKAIEDDLKAKKETFILNYGEDPEEWTKSIKKQINVPEKGIVEDGYRFKGGNPADKNNWEKQ